MLEFTPGNCWAIEFKMSRVPAAKKGVHIAARDIGAKRKLLVYRGDESIAMRHSVEAMSLLETMNEVHQASG